MHPRFRDFSKIALCTMIGAIGLWACSSEPASTPTTDAGFTYADGATPDAADASSDAGLPYPLTQKCGTATSSDACRACREAKCCQSYDTVFSTDAGNVAADCIIACAQGDAAAEPCYAKCFAAVPSETQHLLDHLACLTQNCSVPCGNGGSKCLTCQTQNCAREVAACALNQDCFLISRCVEGCPAGDLGCTEACNKKYPAPAQALIADEVLCTKNACKAPCNL
jgi:hypothetical protein